MLERFMDQLSLQGVSARLQPSLGNLMSVPLTKIDGRQQSDTNGSLDSTNSTENSLFELDDEITATMAVTTSMDQSAFENFAFNCKEEWEKFVTVLSIS